tara:strand:+ start:105 stop:389 length:285 start_codon:yes stop_codon:yes gene_type:complete
MIKIIICLFSICLVFSGTNIKKEIGKLKGRKLWLSYDNTLIANLEIEFQKIEKGEYNENNSKQIIAIADEYFQIRDAKEKRIISKLIKKLNKIK